MESVAYYIVYAETLAARYISIVTLVQAQNAM